MKRSTIAIALVYWAAMAFAQTSSPKRRPSTPAEQAAVIEKVREHALNYTKQLPNYICTQRTRQLIQQPETSGRLCGGLDLIEEQISFVDNRETHTVMTLNGHPVAADSSDQRRGTPSRGEFGTILEAIFDPETTANLEWKRQASLDHRAIYVLNYRVPQLKGYTLTESKRTIQVPYQGFVYADAETLGVVRIEMKVLVADIPKDSEYVNVGLTLDYNPEPVAGQEHILPSHYLLNYQMKKGMAFYGAEYTNYRKFSADTTIQFEGDKKP
jgi:hypothetical protein